MVLQKEDIWDRLQTESVWVTNERTAIFAAVAERQFRYVVGIWLKGNMDQTVCIRFEKLEENAEYTMKFSPIPVAPADFRQIPKGSYSIVDPLMTFEGGTRLYGRTDGLSINVTVNYWDWDV